MKINSAVTYLNSEENLIKQIKKNKYNSKYNFDQYIYKQNNTEKNILSLI